MYKNTPTHLKPLRSFLCMEDLINGLIVLNRPTPLRNGRFAVLKTQIL